MGVANTKSSYITDADTRSPPRSSPLVHGGRLRESVGTVETAAADDADSVYRLVRVRSSDRISSVEIAHDAITNMSTADIGVYDIAADGGAAVDIDEFGAGVDMSSASSGFVDVTNEAVAADLAKIAQPLWQRLGLTADPHKEYDICVTATTNDPSTAASMAMRVRYCAGD